MSLIAAALLSVAASIGGKTAAGGNACGVVVTPPKGWSSSVIAGEKAGSCEVHLAPPDWEKTRRYEAEEWDVPPYAIRIRVVQDSLEAACTQFGLCRKVGGWYFSGRGGAPLAVEEQVADGVRIF